MTKALILCRGLLGSNLASYSVGPGLESQPGKELS
jgi:hypothetical protein